MTDMKIARFTAGSECSYADAVVVYDTPSQRDSMIAAFVAECTKQERDACYVEGERIDPAIYEHAADTPAEVDSDDLDDATGLHRGDGSTITFRDIMGSGVGVTLLSSGLNG